MKKKIIACDEYHLRKLINHETRENGYNCDLNHIDVSCVTDMNSVFCDSKFNGDISKWDVSNVKSLSCMFLRSRFNGDISQWDVSSVKDISSMFSHSKFNGDISNWDVSNIERFHAVFSNSDFMGDLSKWKPYNSDSRFKVSDTFTDAKCPIPYWCSYQDREERRRAIDNYWLTKELSEDLADNKASEKKIKI